MNALTALKHTLLATLVIAATTSLPARALPPTTFTYQGVLKSQGVPVNGQRDIRVTLYGQATGGTPVGNPSINIFPAVNLVNGALTLSLNFGDATSYDLKDRWIEIQVSGPPSGLNQWQTVGQRIQLLTTPNAIQSLVAATVAPGAIGTSSLADGAVSQPKIASGQVVKSLNGLHDDVRLAAGTGVTLTPSGNTIQISASGAGTGWNLAGNVGTSPTANFLGTTDNQPLVLRVNNTPALRFEPNGASAANVIGGYSQNSSGGAHAAVIAGGGTSGSINMILGDYAFVGAGHGNHAGRFGVIGGGAYNEARGEFAVLAGGAVNTNLAEAAFLGGGTNNVIQAGAAYATLVGGSDNVIGPDAPAATITGGQGNRAAGQNSVVSGGLSNVAEQYAATVSGGGYNKALGEGSSISGGQLNIATGMNATVAGGENNRAVGWCSFAAGHQARALHNGSLVFADVYQADFGSTRNNEVSFRAHGGLRLSPETALRFGDTTTGELKPDQGGALELGDSSSDAHTPYIDFHYGVKAPEGATPDFSVRLINDADRWLTVDGNLNVRHGVLRVEGADIEMAGGQSIRSTGRMHIQAGEDLFLNPWGGAGMVHVGGADGPGDLFVHGTASVQKIIVRGGADLAEPFPMSGGEPPKGALVVIDAEHPGRLKLADTAYDTCVAGIISGANGVHPGISLRQEERLEGGQDVALSGRVYALADATSGAIRPGDLLTSSARPGHVMKATDPTRTHGAVVGKAMSSLAEGQGYVLVLVTLQ